MLGKFMLIIYIIGLLVNPVVFILYRARNGIPEKSWKQMIILSTIFWPLFWLTFLIVEIDFRMRNRDNK